MKNIKLSEIHITDAFKNTIPSPKKFGDKLAKYKWTKGFDSSIVVNGNNVLIDGYITYLIAKMFDIEEIDVAVIDK